ncbi:MAG TPA: phenylalanine--tRNA ligase subunit alpha, partial [Candidatus Methylomirabilis sp.]
MTDILGKLNSMEAIARLALDGATDDAALEQVRVRFLGRKGDLAAILRGLVDVDPARRPEIGKRANEVKQWLEAALAARREALLATARAAAEAEHVDVTLPGRPVPMGRLHPSTQI